MRTEPKARGPHDIGAARLLTAIAGVGARTAEAVVARVDKPKAFVGQLPVEAGSGEDRGAEPDGLAARQALGRSPVIRARFDRVMRGDPEPGPEAGFRHPTGLL